MRPVHAERIHQAQHVLRHIAQAVQRADRQAKPEPQTSPYQIRPAQVVHMLAQADVAVVGANHPVTRIQQCLHKLLRPSHQLHAQAHDQ